MADATGKALALVTQAATKATTGQARFAARVQEVLETHGDIASEQTWQAMAVLVAEHWLLLSNEQRPLDSWGMLSRCSDVVLRLRKQQRQGQDSGGADALEQFRTFMGEVLGQDTEE